MDLGLTFAYVRAFIFQVDIAYAPFVEQFHPLLLDLKKYDITSGRPNLTTWIEVVHVIFFSVEFAYWQIKVFSTYVKF